MTARMIGEQAEREYRSGRPLTTCADCGDFIQEDDEDDAWTDPYNGDKFHADCDDRSHDIRRCDCAMCDEDRNDR